MSDDRSEDRPDVEEHFHELFVKLIRGIDVRGEFTKEFNYTINREINVGFRKYRHKYRIRGVYTYPTLDFQGCLEKDIKTEHADLITKWLNMFESVFESELYKKIEVSNYAGKYLLSKEFVSYLLNVYDEICNEIDELLLEYEHSWESFRDLFINWESFRKT